jgi:hypothetical protein
MTGAARGRVPDYLLNVAESSSKGTDDMRQVSGRCLRKDVCMMMTILGLAGMVLNLLAISDVLSSSRDLATKFVLLALILALPFIGAGLYLFAFREKK